MVYTRIRYVYVCTYLCVLPRYSMCVGCLPYACWVSTVCVLGVYSTGMCFGCAVGLFSFMPVLCAHQWPLSPLMIKEATDTGFDTCTTNEIE